MLNALHVYIYAGKLSLSVRSFLYRQYTVILVVGGLQLPIKWRGILYPGDFMKNMKRFLNILCVSLLAVTIAFDLANLTIVNSILYAVVVSMVLLAAMYFGGFLLYKLFSTVTTMSGVHVNAEVQRDNNGLRFIIKKILLELCSILIGGILSIVFIILVRQALSTLKPYKY